MKRKVAGGCVLVLAGFLGAAQAQHAANPTGTWKRTVQGRGGGQPREQVLKLKLDADKLTGALVGRDGQETAITEATFKDGTVSFKVTRRFNDNEFTTTYTGKLDGDTIKGKFSREIQGETRETDWEAKRDKTAQA
jgi:hypothetical protein